MRMLHTRNLPEPVVDCIWESEESFHSVLHHSLLRPVLDRAAAGVLQ